MLLTADFIQRGINVMAEKFAPKKSRFSTKHTIKKTVKTTDGLIIAILALLILLMEVCLIVFLLIRTIKEVKPGMDRNIRLVLIFLVPELYGLGYFFASSKKSSYIYNN